jgi:hypothetical protein
MEELEAWDGNRHCIFERLYNTQLGNRAGRREVHQRDGMGQLADLGGLLWIEWWHMVEYKCYCTWPLSEVTTSLCRAALRRSGGTANLLQIATSMTAQVDWVSLWVRPLQMLISSSVDFRSNYATTTFKGILLPPCLFTSGSRSNYATPTFDGLLAWTNIYKDT